MSCAELFVGHEKKVGPQDTGRKRRTLEGGRRVRVEKDQNENCLSVPTKTSQQIIKKKVKDKFR